VRSFAKFGLVGSLRILIAGLALNAPAFARAAETVILKSTVQVATDEVTLRDLVVTGDVAGASENIVICRAPGAGSVRILSQAEIAAALKKHEASYLLRGAEQVNVTRVGRKVSAAELQPLIEAALNLHDAGMKIHDVQLQAAIFVNDVAGLKLRKLRFDPAINKYRAWFVTSDAPHAVTFEAMATLEQGSAPQEINLPGTKQFRAETALLVRRGETAAMQLDGEGFSAMLSVICLENGGPSRTVRVREPGSKKIYRAQVIGQGQLRAVGREN